MELKECLEKELITYKVFNTIIGQSEDDRYTSSQFSLPPDILTQSHLHVFIQRLTSNDQIALRDVYDLYIRLDLDKSGVLDYVNFNRSFFKLLEQMTPDMSFVLNNESGFDEEKEELLILVFTNCLLSGYKAECALFKDLDSKLPLKLVLRREVDLAKTFDTGEVNGQTLLEEAAFYLGDKSLLATAIYSLNNSGGLARLSKSFSLLNHLDYPKDFAFMASFFEPKLKEFTREKFLQQVFMLLDSTTDEACQLELVKILYYVYNSLKFKNCEFNFRETLRAEQAEHLLLGDDALRRVLMLAVQATGKQLETALLILVNIVKYTEQEFLAIADRDYLSILFSKVTGEANLNAYAALALLLYCLSLKHRDIQSRETIDSLTQMARHLVDTQNWELVLYGIRIYSLLLARIEPSADYFFFLEQVKKMIAGDERLLHVESLKLLRAAAAAGKFGAIALEVEEILGFIKAKLLEGNSSEARLASQIVWNLSFSNHNLLVFDLKLHENVLKGLETPSRANFDQLVCLKSFLQNKVTIGLLADTNIIPVLFSLLLTYKGPDKNCSRCLSSAGSFSDLPLLCLILENTRLILDYGFRSSDNSNLFSSYFANFNRTKFQEFGESLCQDRKLILRNLNNAFLTSICEKNVLHNVSGLCSILIRIFTYLKHYESIKDIETTEKRMIDCFGEHYGWDQDRWQELHQWENLTIKFTLTYIDQHSQQDNRFFTQKGTQSFKELSREVEARYRHLGSIRLSFLMPTNEQITLDSEEVYEMILRESAKKARNKRELEVTLYVKKVDSGFAWDQNNSGWRGAGLPANSPIAVQCSACRLIYYRETPPGKYESIVCSICQSRSANRSFY